MKNYEEIAYLKTESTFHIEKAYDKGYDQGYNDCKVELLEDEAKCHYQEGYNEGYKKGVERGKEARVAEADCAYQCGMKRAWKAARKIVLSPKEGGLGATTVREIFGMPYESALMKYSAKNAIEMIEAWEKKKEQTEKSCNTCANLSEENGFTDFCWDECDNKSEWTPKQEQTEKVDCDNKESCNICEFRGHNANELPCSKCIGFKNFMPKKDAPETNVESIKNRDKIVKALAGLLAAYGEQLWDVVADMQKNP